MAARLITHETVPCWMRISSQTDSPAISILVHRDVVPQLYSITASDRLVQALLRNAPEGGVDFPTGATGKWGFGDSFTLSAETSTASSPSPSKYRTSRCSKTRNAPTARAAARTGRWEATVSIVLARVGNAITIAGRSGRFPRASLCSPTESATFRRNATPRQKRRNYLPLKHSPRELLRGKRQIQR